jgi:hypothetical protein
MPTDPETLYRIGDLERKVDHLYKHLGIDPPARSDTVSDRVRQLVAEGKTIEAIQVHRSESGKDLANAKADIDALQ